MNALMMQMPLLVSSLIHNVLRAIFIAATTGR